MKVHLVSLMIALFSIMPAKAMSYQEARTQARFLTDKMAYELNLNDDQYNNAYEINLDYLISIKREQDAIYYLSNRNRDLHYILHDWQYELFAAADYFFRPIRWFTNRWHYPIYAHYSTNHFYYNCPRVYWHYKGGHGGRSYRHTSYYEGRRPAWQHGFRGEHRGPINNQRPNRPEMGNPNNRPSNRPNTRPGNGFHFESTTRPTDHYQRPSEGRYKDKSNNRNDNNEIQRRVDYRKNSDNPGKSERRTPTTMPNRRNDSPSRSERRTSPPQRLERRLPARENVNSYQRKSSTRSTVNSSVYQLDGWTRIPS